MGGYHGVRRIPKPTGVCLTSEASLDDFAAWAARCFAHSEEPKFKLIADIASGRKRIGRPPIPEDYPQRFGEMQLLMERDGISAKKAAKIVGERMFKETMSGNSPVACAARLYRKYLSNKT
jgi:hypothetical protein